MTMGWCAVCEKKASTLYKAWVHVVRDDSHQVKKASGPQVTLIRNRLKAEAKAAARKPRSTTQ